jgi:hypothetical protein
MVSSEMKNWVERRALQDKNLETGAPGVWSAVRSALEDACRSYNEHYSHDANFQEVSCKLENGNRVVITRTRAVNNGGTMIQWLTEEIIVSFDKTASEVKVARKDGSARYEITSNQEGAFIMQHGKTIDADETSRQILEPLFFLKDEKKRAVFKIS